MQLQTAAGKKEITPEQMRELEWLETDGLGGFASSTVSGLRTRRYHAALISATRPPIGRMTMVQGIDLELITAGQTFLLSVQAYGDGILGGEGLTYLESFSTEPWPTWCYYIPRRGRLRQELFLPHLTSAVVLRWFWESEDHDLPTLRVRPFFSGRDFHALHHQNDLFNFFPDQDASPQFWQFYPDIPAIRVEHSGSFQATPLWYKNFFYAEEKARGFAANEDLAAPGCYDFSLAGTAPATLIFSAGLSPQLELSAQAHGEQLAEMERTRRNRFPTWHHRSAAAYLVQRGDGLSLIAGYPWFEDWGRDTFIAMRGLCLATGELQTAEKILSEWAHQVSEGMLPNRFPDAGHTPEYNSVDASLWYVIVVHEFLAAATTHPELLKSKTVLLKATQKILNYYRQGTRFGIRMDSDYLLASGVTGMQLTWMDAKVGDWVVTPRIGKPVEIQALWINALRLAAAHHPEWLVLAEAAEHSFQQRFWNPTQNCLYDVVDLNHVPGACCSEFRPNQIFALGGLPYPLLSGEQAQQILRQVEEKLWTPLGLRSLAPDEEAYKPVYQGTPVERDGAYHQGTVWPWLAGAFIEAWVRCQNGTKAEALQKFVEPQLFSADCVGLNHLPEIADATAPFASRGCPFQAWSLGEILRLKLSVLA